MNAYFDSYADDLSSVGSKGLCVAQVCSAFSCGRASHFWLIVCLGTAGSASTVCPLATESELEHCGIGSDGVLTGR